MSANQKQPAAGGPQTQRYSNSPYQPIITQHTNGSDAFHSNASYVTQNQGPNQGPGLRNIQPTRPPNQSSTPPNTDLNVTNLQPSLSPMQFVPNPNVRPPPAATFFPNRGAGVPPTQNPRMPNQQHRGQTPVFQSQYVAMQPMYLPGSLYYAPNSRPPNNMMNPPSFTQPTVFQQSFSNFPQFSSSVSSGVPIQSYAPLYPVYPPQSGPISLTRPSATPVTAAPPNPPAGTIANAPIMAPPPAAQTNYSRNSRQRRSKAIPIIDPNTGQDKLDEIFETKTVSHPASGESSARQTPQPPNNNKEIQAAFAKQVAQAINEDKRFSDSLDQPYESSEQFAAPPPPPPLHPNPRFDVQNSTLQCDAKEFISAKEATPIVSANSNAAEVILAKKDGHDSPTKTTRKQSHPKPEIFKEQQPKETECDTTSSIVKEETNPVPQPVENTAQSAAPPIVEQIKETPDKKGAKKPEPEPPTLPTVLPPENASQNAGKSKNKHNRNNQQQHNQNGKTQAVPPPKQQPAAATVVAVPVPQPPKPNNRSNKSKELNMKGANKEGTDMDAFNDKVNANAAVPVDDVTSDAVNANVIAPQPSTPPPPAPAVVPKKETEPVVCAKENVDANENVTKPETETAVAPPQPAPKPATKLFDVTSIVKESALKMMPPFPIHDANRDETDRAATDTATLQSGVTNQKASFERTIVYKPGQWAPDCPDGKKAYDREFLMRLKNFPASLHKPDNIPDAILSDERNRQIDGRLSMGGRTDYSTPPYNSYGGKSGSQRGTLPKRNSQSNKMGSRGGDKITNKHQPKVTISLSRDEVKLHESENAWKPARFNKGENASEEEKKTETLYKKVRAVLNKLTPQKFETLVNQVRQLQIDTKERLQGVIDLVFEKAIDEPNFSVAYAMMCKEIQNMQVSVTSAGGEDKKLAFRTLLVTRCQMEFEKQSVDETTRNTKVKEIEECADPEKKKELQFELEESDRRVRMKSVGCIRFIGELFKQQMLTASIMRRCLQTLLENKDEESLECLCKLLTTVGKELESNRVELVSIFNEMKQITEGKRQKVSSRIRFMLRDVIDLRDSRWIPRRGDLNPKTIDQIQKEAETEQLNSHVMNISEPHRKDERNNGPRGGGGGGGGGGGNRQRVTDDGWNSVSSRNNRQQAFAFEANKVKAGINLPQADEPFGGAHTFNRWVKGSAPIKNAQPQTTIQLNTNFFATLENYDPEKRPNSNQRNKDSYSSKGPSMERGYNKNYEGRGSRSGSQHRDSMTPMRTTAPPPTVAPPKHQTTPAPPPPTVNSEPKLSDEQLERRIRNSLDEFINGCITTSEYVQDVATILPQTDYPRIVFESYNFILEKSQTARLKTGELFAKLVKLGHVTVDDYLKGVAELVGSWEDLVIDIPQVWQYFAEDIVPLLLEEALPLAALHRQLDSLGIVRDNQAKRLLKPLFAYVVKEKGPNFLKTIWQRSTLQLDNFMPSGEVEAFVKENNLDFLLGGDFPVGEGLLLSYDEIQQKLSRFLQERAPFDDIVNWISANVGGRVKENDFIRTLATAIFENSIAKNKLQPDVLSSNTKLIQKYVDANLHYELQCLYALQALVRKLEYPQGLLLSICNKLYEDSTFSQESFIAWHESQDPAEKEGKGVAFIQLTSFFTQLRENEEDDESSSNAEDA